MANNPKTILITGGAGYIGTVTAHKLREAGFRPILFDQKPWRNWHRSLRTMDCVRGDICDKEALGDLFSQFCPNCVIHLAARVSARQSMVMPYRYYLTNIVGGIILLDVMDVHKCNKMVFSSSVAVYGNREKEVTEKDHVDPMNVYGETKLALEEILRFWKATKRGTYIILRYANVVGKYLHFGHSARGGKSLLHTLADINKGDRETLAIFGRDHHTVDGTMVRDYVHVDDVARANVLAVEYLFKNRSSDVLLIGTGQGFSVNTVVKQFEKIVGKPIRKKFIKSNAHEISMSVVNPQRAKTILGWTATQADLEKTLQDYV